MSKPKRSRYGSLDHWRGVACLMIVVFHSVLCAYASMPRPDYLPVRALRRIALTMKVGVPIFFVISGYCIAASCDSARRRSDGPGVYFARRFRRIYPTVWIYFALLAATVALAELASWGWVFTDGPHPIRSPFQLTARQWLGNLTLTETWSGHLWPPSALFSGQIWTLCYEEQFYLICGLFLFLVPRYFFAGCLAITAIVVALLSTIGRAPLSGFFLDGFWFVFAEGILVYWAINYDGGKRAYAILITVLLALASCWLGGISVPLSEDYTFGGLFALSILFLHPFDDRIMGLRILAPLHACGIRCYSLYLVHGPITRAIVRIAEEMGIRGIWGTIALTMPAALAASLIAAWIFHAFVERRFLNPPLKADRLQSVADSSLVARPSRVLESVP